MKRTYIDSNVLIAAFQGDESVSRRAMEVLDDANRCLVVSDYLRLEVLPKPRFHKLEDEIEFMQTVLGNASENVPTSPALTGRAVDLASQYDMTGVSATGVNKRGFLF